MTVGVLSRSIFLLICSDPCYTTTHYDATPPIDDNTGEARIDVINSEPGDCVVKFSIVSSVNPPAGPAGTIECDNVSQEGEISLVFSN